jgi:hypothetical protein
MREIEVNQNTDVTPITIAPPHIVINRPIELAAPGAAERLLKVPAVSRPETVERLLELGNVALDAIQSNATIAIVEAKLTTLDEQLNTKLASTMAQDRLEASTSLSKILNEHDIRVRSVLSGYFDETSTSSIPSVVGARLQSVGVGLMDQLHKMLDAGDEGALTKIKDQIVKEIREQTTTVLAQVSARHALLTKSNLAGKPFEEAVTMKVSEIARPLGDQVEGCGDSPVSGKGSSGDVLQILNVENTRGEVLKLVFEAKRRDATGQRFSHAAIAKSLDKAKKTRNASAAIFVADSADVLPNGLSFGHSGKNDYFVAFNPELGDDTGLASAIYLARSAMLAELVRPESDGFDRPAAESTIAELRTNLEAFAKIESDHEAALKAVQRAGLGCDDLRSRITFGLRKLDELVTA